MIEPTKLSCLLLISLAAALAGCGSPDSQAPTTAAPSTDSKTVEMGSTASTPAAAAAAASGDASRERVLRAVTCQIVLSQAVGTKMVNADTGLPPDLEARLKVSATTRWDVFAVKHALAAGVTDEDRFALIQSHNALVATDEDRQHTIDTVRDCLDNEP